ncbi:MAG: hypothetical protein ACE5Q6_18750 [Dehalococcoidia bacterium]
MPNEEIESLMTQAVEMYLHDEEERNVSGSSYEGRLRTERKYELLGGFGGQRFDMDLDTAYGRDSASFLVNEQTQSPGMAFSRN